MFNTKQCVEHSHGETSSDMYNTNRIKSWGFPHQQVASRGVETMRWDNSLDDSEDWNILELIQWIGSMENLQESIGNHRFSHERWDFPVFFPLKPIERLMRHEFWKGE